MSAGPIRSARSATTATPIPRWKVGELVTPDQHPEQCAVWRVDRFNGVLVILTPTVPGPVKMISRHPRTLKRANQ